MQPETLQEITLRNFSNLFHHIHVAFNLLEEPFDAVPEMDMGFRRSLYPSVSYSGLFRKVITFCAFRDNIIYHLIDEFLCHYTVIRIPNREKTTYLFIGPYTVSPFSEAELLQASARYGQNLAAGQFSLVETYYKSLPMFENRSLFDSLLNLLGEYLWGNMDNFTLETIDRLFPLTLEPITERPDQNRSEDAYLRMQIMEGRYSIENELIKAVSQGQNHKAVAMLSEFTDAWMEKRNDDPVRNLKNYSIILNTLLRKAAEIGTVHPIHIDSLSSSFAYKIESIRSEAEFRPLMKSMVRKYCLLVKSYSMQRYSLLVRKVLIRIDSDLTADLSLKAQSELLNVNPSYLSTLFKKDTGSTLTEYVNHKRIEHAIFLLNSTNMQIQTIALNCGIPDVNYFTKVFKKQIGKTPKEYRDLLFQNYTD